MGVVAVSDDLSNVGMMLEGSSPLGIVFLFVLLLVMRALTQSSPMKHDILFNWNGAEETLLQVLFLYILFIAQLRRHMVLLPLIHGPRT